MGLFDWFIKKKIYKGGIVSLKERYREDENTAYDGVPAIYYDIIRSEDNIKVGQTDLRLTSEGDMYYYGNIGYNIRNQYRGNHYAYYACKLLFEIARDEFNMRELIITCSPDNVASYKTLERLGGELVELADVPKNHTLYALGEKKKYVFKYKI